MEKITYFMKTDGISLERMVRSGNFDMRVHHFHNEYEIFFLVEGERHFFFNNRAYFAKGGSLIIVDSNAIHMTRSIPHSDMGHDRIILYVDKAKMEEFDKHYPRLHLVHFLQEHYGVYDLSPGQQQQFLALYECLQSEFENKEKNYKELIELEVLRYLTHFSRENHKSTPLDQQTGLSSGEKSQVIYAIVDHIATHYDEKITLDSLAQQFYMSKYYLCRSFKEITGQGVNEYVNILRIKKAMRFLEETDLSISQISRMIGFGSATYFEKVFKLYMTLSPLQYRKQPNIVTYTNMVSP